MDRPFILDDSHGNYAYWTVCPSESMLKVA